jgi:hypothetical protein
MKRVHIVGGPSCGKTALARLVASRIGAPAYSLDDIAYSRETGYRTTLVERLDGARHIAALPAWVAEGIYLYWTEDLMKAADTIVWLDRPLRSAARRIVGRRLAGLFSRGGAGDSREGGAPSGLHWAREYYRARGFDQIGPPDDDFTLTRTATEEQLARHGAKVVRCRTRQDVARFLATLSAD